MRIVIQRAQLVVASNLKERPDASTIVVEPIALSRTKNVQEGLTNRQVLRLDKVAFQKREQRGGKKFADWWRRISGWLMTREREAASVEEDLRPPGRLPRPSSKEERQVELESLYPLFYLSISGRRRLKATLLECNTG